MLTVPANQLTQLGIAAFQKAAIPMDEARTVTDLLIEANLAGHDSTSDLSIDRDVRSSSVSSKKLLLWSAGRTVSLSTRGLIRWRNSSSGMS